MAFPRRQYFRHLAQQSAGFLGEIVIYALGKAARRGQACREGALRYDQRVRQVLVMMLHASDWFCCYVGLQGFRQRQGFLDGHNAWRRTGVESRSAWFTNQGRRRGLAEITRRTRTVMPI